MRLKPTKTTIALLGGAVGVMLLLFGAMVYWEQTVIVAGMKVQAEKDGQVSEGRRIARRREDARVALEQDQAKLQFLESSVSNAAYVPTLLKQLEELALNTNNQVVGVRPQTVLESPTRLQQRRDPEAQASGDKQTEEKKKEDAKAAEPYTRLGIQVNLVGSYRTVQAFTDHLMRFPKILAVEEMQLRPHRGVGGEVDTSLALLDVDLKLTAFIMKEAVPAKPVVTSIADSQVGGIN